MAVYDPQINEWTDVGAMAGEHRKHTATFLQDGFVLIVSGMGNSGLLSEVSEGTSQHGRASVTGWA